MFRVFGESILILMKKIYIYTCRIFIMQKEQKYKYKFYSYKIRKHECIWILL